MPKIQKNDVKATDSCLRCGHNLATCRAKSWSGPSRTPCFGGDGIGYSLRSIPIRSAVDSERTHSTTELASRIDRIKIVSQTVEVLIVDLLEWLSRKQRSYEETMEVWRTCCPKLPVWEDAIARGLVYVESANRRSLVRLTSAGVELLTKVRPER